jgi:hypothetical protein
MPTCRIPHGRGGEPDTTRSLATLDEVFPTGVGANRTLTLRPFHSFPHRRWGRTPMRQAIGDETLSIPHARGGESFDIYTLAGLLVVFPTGVGANRTCPNKDRMVVTFSPRAWGRTADIGG